MQSWNSYCHGYAKSCDEGMKMMLVTKNYVVLENTYHCPAVAVLGRLLVGGMM